MKRVEEETSPDLGAGTGKEPPQSTAAGISKDGGNQISDLLLEDVVAEVWSIVLNSDDFTHNDHFFDVGGSSFGLLIIHDHLAERLPGLNFTVPDLFRHLTVAEMSAFLRSIADR